MEYHGISWDTVMRDLASIYDEKRTDTIALYPFLSDR